jgi:uncharacterized protein
MKIAVVSDSHDHIPLLRRAIAQAVNLGAQAILHCGDVVAPSSLEKLGVHQIPIYVIHGNNQGDAWGMARLAAKPEHQLRYLGQDGVVELAGRQIFVVHYPHYARAMAATGDYDIVFCGHTHQPEILQQPNLHNSTTPVLNPGTVGGVGASATFAMVDLATLAAEIITVDDQYPLPNIASAN